MLFATLDCLRFQHAGITDPDYTGSRFFALHQLPFGQDMDIDREVDVLL